jgi:hypothetical protein
MMRVRRNRPLSILSALDDDLIFASHFKEPVSSWDAWRVFLAALFALPLSDSQLELYRQCTGRSDPPTDPASEAWLCCGRRSGKSFTLALVAVFLACFRDWRPYLAVGGERATIQIIAADRKQSRVILRFVLGLLQGCPMLAQTIESLRQDRIDLNNRVTLEVHTASYKTTRGYTVVAALLDELAFFPTEDSARPDHEIIAALRPGMATIPNSILLCASSPYARRGELWEAHRKYFGKQGNILIWQAPTRLMNPTVPQRVIDEAMERDPSSAQSEYFANFRTDIEAYVSREAVLACVSEHVLERPPVNGIVYRCFVDPAGGSGGDSFTLAIGHRHGDIAVLDCLREVKPPFSPQSVVQEFSELLKTYRISKIHGDHYAGEWPREAFRSLNITYERAVKAKSALYQALLPTINSKRADLLDHPKLISQLTNLERRVSRGGRDVIEHPPMGHDDVANSVAGVIDLLQKGQYDLSLSWIDCQGIDSDPADAARDNRRRITYAHVMSGGTRPYLLIK